jgi:hypothetical protein
MTSTSEGIPHRRFVMASEEVWRWFHRRWHEIDVEWRGCPSIIVKAARDELRKEAKMYVSGGFSGTWLIPV